MSYELLDQSFSMGVEDASFLSSKNGLHHFEAVKYLLHPSDGRFRGHTLVLSSLCGQLSKRLLGLVPCLFLMMVLPVVLAVMAVMIGFDQFFTLFHQVLFARDNTWLFDPRVDSIILALPEDYFMHAF